MWYVVYEIACKQRGRFRALLGPGKARMSVSFWSEDVRNLSLPRWAFPSFDREGCLGDLQMAKFFLSCVKAHRCNILFCEPGNVKIRGREVIMIIP